MQRLYKSIEALTLSYDNHGLVNQAGSENLPSRDSIDDILTGLDELMFPGFREAGALDNSGLRLSAAEKVYHLARELVGELE